VYINSIGFNLRGLNMTKEDIKICIDEELNEIVNDEHERNGFDLNEFVNNSLKERFNID
jgi:hypothetical protein